MSRHKKTSFQDDWLKKAEFKYITADPKDPHSAFCSLCRKTFRLSNMGQTAMNSHIGGKKHKSLLESSTSSYGMKLFTRPIGGEEQGAAQKGEGSRSADEDRPAPVIETSKGGSSSSDPNTPGLEEAKTSTSNKSPAQINGMSRYILKQDVTRAEIIWSLGAVENHLSLSSAGKCVSLFPLMFGDSPTAGAMQLGRSKLAYVIVHGLAPYFHEEVCRKARESEAFTISFDESLNKRAQQCQMDVAIIYWDKETNNVVVRYLESEFLGHTTAADLLKAFKTGLKTLNLKKMINVSLDGPNVNLKFLKDLKVELRSMNGQESPMFVFLGTCGLHSVNNAFKNGAKATLWSIVDFLRACFNLFKNVPARRQDYGFYSKSSLFPLKFCAVRWLQNKPIAERAIAVIPNLKLYIDGVRKDGKEKDIGASSYKVVTDALKDGLLAAKLSFFAYIAGLVEPFLTEFQTAAPMAPFLYSALEKVLRDLLEVIVKPEVLQKTSDVVNIDLEKESDLLTAQKVTFSFSVKAELRKVKVSDLEMLKFKQECKLFVKVLCKKLIRNSPLKYTLCQGISCCDPGVIAARSATTVKNRLSMCLSVLEEHKWLAAGQCDKIEQELLCLVKKPEVLQLCKSYERSEQRLVDFWVPLLTNKKASENLKYFFRLVLVISHGNAFVERGFSVNKEVIIENQRNESLVGQRQVYDAIKAAGGIDKVEMTQELFNKVKFSRQRYMNALKAEEKAKEETEVEKLKKKRVSDQLRALKDKRMRLCMELQQETEAIDREIEDLMLD